MRKGFLSQEEIIIYEDAVPQVPYDSTWSFLNSNVPFLACHFDADPFPTFYFDADPDPSFHFDADPDPSFQEKAYHFDANPDTDPDYHSDADADPDPTFQFDADPSGYTTLRNSLF
jgi:hypothetical protein